MTERIERLFEMTGIRDNRFLQNAKTPRITHRFPSASSLLQLHNRLPKFWNESDATEFRQIVGEIANERKLEIEFDDNLIELFLYLSRGNV
jgi:hypothetical protein